MLRYLGRQRQVPNREATPICQLVSVTQLLFCQRCQFCRYFEESRSYNDIVACSDRNMCGRESNLYSLMGNGEHFGAWYSNKYTPVRLFRQRVINSETRYLQYISSDFSGYACNHLCQFYPARITDGKTIATCAQTNKCGRNASFFELLLLADNLFDRFPDVNRISLTNAQLMLLDGSIIDYTQVTDYTRKGSGEVLLEVQGYGQLPLIDWRYNSPTAGYVLNEYENNDLFQGFTDPCIFDNDIPDNAILLHTPFSDLITTLQTFFYYHMIYEEPLRHFSYVQWPDGNKWYMYLSDTTCVRLPAAYRYILSFTPPQTNKKYIIKFGATSNYCLAAPYPNSEPSRWTRVSYSNEFGTGYTVVRITSYNDSLALWLRSLGVSDSFFTNLQ